MFSLWHIPKGFAATDLTVFMIRGHSPYSEFRIGSVWNQAFVLMWSTHPPIHPWFITTFYNLLPPHGTMVNALQRWNTVIMAIITEQYKFGGAETLFYSVPTLIKKEYSLIHAHACTHTRTMCLDFVVMLSFRQKKKIILLNFWRLIAFLHD